ncbi:MAG: toprim domain-containing protein [Pseudomonadota bacterium]
MTRQQYTIDQIKDLLLAQIGEVAQRYAPPASGSYTDGHLYFTLNPGRADRSVGSFCIHLTGPKAGRWYDYASDPRGGDLLDLIGMSLQLSASDAIREARAFLGLQHETPELVRARAEAAERARANRAEAERRTRDDKRRKAKQAQAIWLSAEARIAGTPVEHYLKGRGIDLRALGHQPGALRYLAECFYTHTDAETGEVTEARLPAMVAAIANGKGDTIALHRTYLAIGPGGIWTKARLPAPKKVLGDFRGGRISLSSGTGARGGKAGSLNACPPGTRVYIAEGIETALSAVVLRPEARVLAAVSLGNMGQVELPANVAEVVIIADADEGNPQAAAAFKAAIAAHVAKGRTVRVWRSDVPGEDFNDALQRVLREQATEPQDQGAS